MRPTNCANNFSEAGIANVNGYSDPPPTIIETAFSVPINVPSLTTILCLCYSSHSHFHVYRWSSLTIVLFSSFNSESMIWKSSANSRVDDRVPEIYGLPEAWASYKLNLRNYESNYIEIRTITRASAISTYLSYLISISLYEKYEQLYVLSIYSLLVIIL